MEKTLSGVPVSPGVAIGSAYVIVESKIGFSEAQCSDVEHEKERLLEARNKTRDQLLELKDIITKKISEAEAKIFDAHIGLLEDDDLLDETNEIIEDECLFADYALFKAMAVYTDMLAQSDDEYLRERVGDLKDISERWIKNIQGLDIQNLSVLPENSVIIAQDLTPSDTANLDLENTLGFVTKVGGRTSHTSIMARSLEIPAVVGIGNALDDLSNMSSIIIDGTNGVVIVHPTDETIEKYKKIKAEIDKEREQLKQYANIQAISKDGTRVKIYANIGSPSDMPGVLKNGADGIGLYRTEFLFMESTDFPTEEKQFEAYQEVALLMEGHTVTIRTMDIGGDKYLPYLEMPKEENPALGWRALRICLDKTDILKTQFRAIFRSSAFGKIKVMLPMIVSIEELRKANIIWEKCKEELKNEGTPFDDALGLGMMIETPAVVFRAESFARESDFFSIGTNDLTQYTLAADRGNEKITHICDSYNPSVLHAIKLAIDGAHASGIVISMCGEFASDTLAVPLLFGLGLDIFSMSPIAIPEVKRMIISLDKTECEMLAKRVLSLNTIEEVKSELEKFADVHERGHFKY